MMRRRSAAVLLLSALTLFACVGESTGDDPEAGLVRETIPSGDAHFVGTYTNSDYIHPGDLTLIVLKMDSTFHAETFVQCVKAPCGPILEDGHYSLLRQDTTTYIQLYLGVTETPIAKYQGELRGDFLNLRLMSYATDGRWIPMLRSPTAWCATDNDCAQQSLIPGPCAGRYLCQEGNICNYHCGSVPESTSGDAKPSDG